MHQHACKTGLGGHRLEALRVALRSAAAGRAEVRESGCSGREAQGGRGLGAIRDSSLRLCCLRFRSNSPTGNFPLLSAIRPWRNSHPISEMGGKIARVSLRFRRWLKSQGQGSRSSRTSAVFSFD